MDLPENDDSKKEGLCDSTIELIEKTPQKQQEQEEYGFSRKVFTSDTIEQYYAFDCDKPGRYQFIVVSPQCIRAELEFLETNVDQSEWHKTRIGSGFPLFWSMWHDIFGGTESCPFIFETKKPTFYYLKIRLGVKQPTRIDVKVEYPVGAKLGKHTLIKSTFADFIVWYNQQVTTERDEAFKERDQAFKERDNAKEKIKKLEDRVGELEEVMYDCREKLRTLQEGTKLKKLDDDQNVQ